MIVIRDACFPEEREEVVALFREYIAGVSVDLGFQDYEREFAALPGGYAHPRGRLLLAARGPERLGCGALRPVDAATCELKRLYVRPAGRGDGLGRRLVERLMDEARAAGYRRVCLDVLPEFAAAQRLYDSLGFAPCAPVSFNPVPGARFLGRDL